MGVFGGVLVTEEEDLPSELLPDLAGEEGGTEAAVEARDVGVGLLEPRMFAAGDREVTDDVQRMPAAGGPPRGHTDNDLGHEPDQPVHLHDVETPVAGRVDRRSGLAVVHGVAVAVLASDALVASRAERPPAIA